MAGLQTGDLIVGVAKKPVQALPELFRAIWSLGTAGTEVPLNVLRAGQLMDVMIQSADRSAYYQAPRLH